MPQLKVPKVKVVIFEEKMLSNGPKTQGYDGKGVKGLRNSKCGLRAQTLAGALFW